MPVRMTMRMNMTMNAPKTVPVNEPPQSRHAHASSVRPRAIFSRGATLAAMALIAALALPTTANASEGTISNAAAKPAAESAASSVPASASATGNTTSPRTTSTKPGTAKAATARRSAARSRIAPRPARYVSVIPDNYDYLWDRRLFVLMLGIGF